MKENDCMSKKANSFAKQLAIILGICLYACEAVAYITGTKLKDWIDPGDGGKLLVNGNYYGENVIWTVTLKAGTAGSLFGDTMGPVETFHYYTIVTVDGVEKLKIDSGTWSSHMGDSTYTEQIPLRELGILDKDACGRYYLTAFTRNYANGSTIDTGYSLITEDTYVDITYSEECDPTRYTLSIEPDHDMTHPDGVMLHVTGTLPRGTPAKIKRDGEDLTTITQQGYLFDYIPPSNSSRRYNYSITVEPKCGEKITKSCSGSPGMARVGKMSITNENYQALVVKYPQDKNLTIEFTDADELARYKPSVVSWIGGDASRPRPGKLDIQRLSETMEETKILYTIDNMKFKEGSHGNYTFQDYQSFYCDREVGLKHVIPEGAEYEHAKSRVLFMRDEYYGMPGSSGWIDDGSKEINWFRYWRKDRDGTVDLLQPDNNIRLGCPEKWRHGTGGSLGHAGFHNDNKHWVCLVSELAHVRTEAFNLPGTSIIVGAGLDGNDENTMACPSNDCHQVAATITHELQHRAVRKKWFEDVGMKFAIDGSGDREGSDISRWFSYTSWNDKFTQIQNNIDHDYANVSEDHLSDGSEQNPLRIGWTCNLNSSVNGIIASDAIRQLQFDITKADTYNIASVHQNWSSYAAYGDNEVCARMSERFYDRDGVHTNLDWSVKNPEKLAIRASTVPAKKKLAAKTASNVSAAEEIGSNSFASSHCPDYEIPMEMRLLGITSAAGYGIKAEGASHYSALRFDVTFSSLTNDLTVLTNSTFLAYGYLADKSGRVVAGTSVDVAFRDSGEVSAAFDFNGKILYNARGSGYTLAAVAVELGGLVDVDLMPVACITNVAECVRTFDYSEFSRPDVVLDKASFTEAKDGTNLLIGISVEVNAPGTYTLEAILAASNHAVVASYDHEVALAEGTNVLTQTFSGERIAEMGIDGPYSLELVKLSRPDGSIADILIDAYVTTNSYSAEDLRPTGDGTKLAYVTGSAGWWEPYEERGNVIALRYGFTIDNPLSSTAVYSVHSVLETEDGTIVGNYATNVTFSSGNNRVVLVFPSSESEAIRSGGRFRVRSVTLVPMADDTGIIRLPPSALSGELLPTIAVWTVTFNANGGTVSPAMHQVEDGSMIGMLPNAVWNGHAFVGWFTAMNDGTQISSSTRVTASVTYYAHWTTNENDGSDRQGEGNVAMEYGLYGSVVGNVPGTVALTYDGYLYDGDGNVKGTIQVKVGKPNKKTGLAAVKATVIGLDGKKKTLKAAEKGKAKIEGDGPTTVSLTGGEACTVVLGAKGMGGTYGGYRIDGGLNVFMSKDAADKAVAAAALGRWQGAVNVAWRLAGDGSPYQTLSVSIAAKGKAKVAGTLADGAKVSAKGQLVVGEAWCCVPVVFVKKGATLAFNVWLTKNGAAAGTAAPHTAVVVGLGEDVKVGKPGTLKAGATFKLDGEMGDAKYGAYLPNGVAVAGGAKWTLPKAGKVQLAKDGTVDQSKLGENPSALKLTYKAKDGTFKGSFKAYSDANGKPKGTTMKVAGVLVNGTGYGAVTVKGASGVAVKIE